MEADMNHHFFQANNEIVQADGHQLRNCAGAFLAAANIFASSTGQCSPVSYYLMCHSIELSLKAFLFSVGFKKRDWKALEPDLERALRSAEDNGLGAHIDITPDDQDLLQKANRLYTKKEFEYFESLETTYDPHDFALDSLASFADRLFNATKEPVRSSVVE